MRSDLAKLGELEKECKADPTRERMDAMYKQATLVLRTLKLDLRKQRLNGNGNGTGEEEKKEVEWGA